MQKMSLNAKEPENLLTDEIMIRKGREASSLQPQPTN
jgi:hypothetical protein